MLVINLNNTKEKMKTMVQNKEKQLKKPFPIPLLYPEITTDTSIECIGVYHFRSPSLSLSLSVCACVCIHTHIYHMYNMYM